MDDPEATIDWLRAALADSEAQVSAQVESASLS